jgi:hypothetical protein
MNSYRPISDTQTIELSSAGPSASAAPARPLRRWSVAELIARAASAPPGDGVLRG